MIDYILNLINSQRPEPVQYPNTGGLLGALSRRSEPLRGGLLGALGGQSESKDPNRPYEGLLDERLYAPGFNPANGLPGFPKPQPPSPFGNSQALVNAGASLLTQSRSNQPIGFGQALGYGLQALNEGNRQAQEDQYRQQAQQFQLADLQSQAQDRQLKQADDARKREDQDNFYRLYQDPKADPRQLSAAALKVGINPNELQPARKAPINIGGVLIDPDTYQPVADYSGVLRGNAAAGRATTQVYNVGPGAPTPDQIGAEAFAKENAKRQSEYFDNVAKAGDTAVRTLSDVQQLRTLLKDAPQGAGQPFINTLASFANRLGIDTGDIANLPHAQAVQSLVSRIAPTLRVPGSGSQSDIEYKGFLNALPSLSNTPQGNEIISNGIEAFARRGIQESQIAQEVFAGNLTPAQGRKAILDLGPVEIPGLQGYLSNSANSALPSGGGVRAPGNGGLPPGFIPVR